MPRFRISLDFYNTLKLKMIKENPQQYQLYCCGLIPSFLLSFKNYLETNLYFAPTLKNLIIKKLLVYVSTMGKRLRTGKQILKGSSY